MKQGKGNREQGTDRGKRQEARGTGVN